MDDILYPCDPNKNVACNKRGCFINGGPCQETRHIEYADVAPVKLCTHSDDLIVRQDAIDAVYKRIKQIGLDDNVYVLSIRQAVVDVPAADVAPVKHGRWNHNKQYGSECSECGTAMFEIMGVSYSSFKPKYCPNCGAKMDK